MSSAKLNAVHHKPDDQAVMARLVAVADALFGGHLTVLKFTSNWRVSFGAPCFYYDEVQAMAEGKTFAEAGQAALAQARKAIHESSERRLDAWRAARLAESDASAKAHETWFLEEERKNGGNWGVQHEPA